MGRLLVALAGVTLASAILSGCLTFGSEKSTSGSPAASVPPTSGANATKNATPVLAAINVTIAGNASHVINGSIPAAVGDNVTFDGSSSTGDNLTFDWNFGDHATGTNATMVHAFASAGLYNVTLTVSGTGGNGSANVLLNVTKGGPSPGDFVKLEKTTFKSTISGLTECQAYVGEGTDVRTFTLVFTAAEADGTATKVDHAVVTMKGTGTTGQEDVDLYFYDPKGAEVGHSNGPTMAEKIEVSKVLAPGTYKIVARGCLGYGMSIQIDAEAEYVAA